MLRGKRLSAVTLVLSILLLLSTGISCGIEPPHVPVTPQTDGGGGTGFARAPGVLSEATLCKSVDQTTKAPLDRTSVFPPDFDVIYCSVKLVNAPANSQIEAQWFDPGNQLLLKTPATTSGSGYIAFSLKRATTAPFSTGTYTVKLFLNGEQKMALNFILGTGTGGGGATSAYLGDAVICEEVDAQTMGSIGVYDTFYLHIKQLFCSVKVVNAPAKTNIKAVWVWLKDGAGGVMNFTVNSASVVTEGTRYVAFRCVTPPTWPKPKEYPIDYSVEEGWQIGEYAVELYVNGVKSKTVPFTIREQVGATKLAISPKKLDAELGKEYWFTTTVVNRPAGSIYQWYLNGQLLAEGDEKKQISLTFNKAGTFYIKVQLVHPTKVWAWDEAVVTVKPVISISMEIIPGTLEGEKGKSYRFEAKAVNPPAGAIYQWFDDDGKLGEGASNVVTITFNKEGPQHITVKLFNPATAEVVAEATASVNIKGAGGVMIWITPDPYNGEAGTAGTFTARWDTASPPPQGSTFRWWRHGESVPGTGATNSIPFPNEGTFTVQAELINPQGQKIGGALATAYIKAKASLPEDPQKLAECITTYQKTILQKHLNDGCKADPGCVAYEVRITKPWTYDPAQKGFVGSYEYWRAWNYGGTIGVKWEKVYTGNDAFVDMATAKKRCEEIQGVK